MVIIAAKVYIRDTCDPNVPGDCAPIIEVEGASELEGLVSQHGIAFEELLQEDEETWEDDPEEYIDPVLELGLEDDIVDEPTCPLEPEFEWDESVCGEIERRILDKVLGE